METAIASALAEVAEQWPIERPIPPLLLWQHTLRHAGNLALKALTFDETLESETRSWAEIPFGNAFAVGVDLPWDPTTPVLIPGTNVLIQGSIDRLDLRADARGVRVSDYKTGRQPKDAARIVIAGGSELQRVTYAIAARQLLPHVGRIIARLIYVGEPQPQEYKLRDVEATVAAIGGFVGDACELLRQGNALPGLIAAPEKDNEFRIALPAAETYFSSKQNALRRAFGAFSRVWQSS